MNIEMRHLRYFAAVAEEASFTAAAQRVHVAQQVLSAQVRQLEDAVGVLLLERTSRGVVLTTAGSAFLGFARETLASLDRGVANSYCGWCHSWRVWRLRPATACLIVTKFEIFRYRVYLPPDRGG